MTSSMKKTALSLLSVALVLAATPAIYAADGAKPPFVVVDVNAVLAQSHEAQALTLEFKGAVDTDNVGLNTIVNDMNAAGTKINDLKAQYANATVQADKDKIKNEFDSVAGLYTSKQQEATTFKTNAEQTLTNQRQAYLQAVIAEIRSTASDIAKKRGIGAVVTTDVALYFDPSWDITKDVITEMNAAPTPPAPAVPAATGMMAPSPAKTTSAAK